MSPIEFCSVFRDIQGELGCDDATAGTMTLAYVIDKFHRQHSADVLADAIGRGIEQGLQANGPDAIADAIRETGGK